VNLRGDVVEDLTALTESQIRERKIKFDECVQAAFDTIHLREAKARVERFDEIVAGSIIQISTESGIPEYAVVLDKTARGAGFKCWLIDGSTCDVNFSKVLAHETDALITPLTFAGDSPLPKAIEDLILKYSEDVFG